MPPRKHVFGRTPWGAYFIRAMEALADAGRLDRGRSYAGNGRVLKLGIEEGRATAVVEGSYRPTYRVVLRFPPLPAADRKRLRDLLAADPLAAGLILAGELPEAFLKKLSDEKIDLLPRRWRDIEGDCDCPDDGDPCKHMAAVYYVIAQEIDRDPTALFRLRGADLSGTGLAAGAEEPLFRTEPFEGASIEAAPGAEGRAFSAPRLASFSAAIPRLLPPAPPVASRDLKFALAEFYHRAAAVADYVFDASADAGGEGADDALRRRWARAAYSFVVPAPGEAGRPLVRAVLPDEADGGSAARELSPFEACRLFSAFDEGGIEGEPAYRFLRAFALAARLVCARQAFVPDVRSDGRTMRVVWKPALFSRDVRALMEELARFLPASTGKDRAAAFLLALFADLLDDYVRDLAWEPSPRGFAEEPAARALFRAEPVRVDSPALRSLPRALDSWLSVFDLAASHFAYELVLDEKGDTGFSLRAKVRPAAVDADGAAPRSMPLRRAAAELGPEALRFPALLSSFLPQLRDLAVRDAVPLDLETAADFILDASPLLSRLGVDVVLPRSLRNLAKPRAKVKAGNGGLVSYLGSDALLGFSWQAAIGEDLVDVAEFEKLAADGRRLVRFRGRWIRIDPAEAAAVLAKLKKGTELGAAEALSAFLQDPEDLDLSARGHFEKLLAAASGARADAAPAPSGLRANFRPYQERGYRWLAGHFDAGLGCLLADDMGLGKTVQAIALILALKETGRLGAGALVCAPASLLGNWERELAKFAPDLSVRLHYGSGRRLKGADVVLTTYETFLRDADKMAAGPAAPKGGERVPWDLLVLDEAHSIKNPDSLRAKAIKTARSRGRVALTGTPVENHLGELWSLFDFILPGYLGTRSAFRAAFRTPVEAERDAEAAERLRRLTSPFLLRRLKTDPAIAGELPEKIVIDEYARLTPEQAGLYEGAVRDAEGRIEAAEPGERRAAVLGLLTGLKQICNHPRNFDKESSPAVERSGKAQLLLAILSTALEAGEKVLVFSQYVEMLGILDTMIRRDLGAESFMLHGSMAKAKRDAAVDAFQAAPGPGVFLISLKAGGVGLNLTAASRVVHYDLWFNPAVENQATDRAFRLGQVRNVFVHRLIARGTFEEKIDAMIKAKTEIAELTVKAGESWLADLDPADIKELVRLE